MHETDWSTPQVPKADINFFDPQNLKKLLNIFPLVPRSIKGAEILPEHVPLEGLLEKKNQTPLFLLAEIWGVKEKFSLHAPSKSLRCIHPEFCPWVALNAPYKWSKFGARSNSRFSARQKMCVEQMPKYSLQKILESGVSWQQQCSMFTIAHSSHYITHEITTNRQIRVYLNSSLES